MATLAILIAIALIVVLRVSERLNMSLFSVLLLVGLAAFIAAPFFGI